MSFLRTKILKMKSNKVTLKVIVSYVLLICVSIVAGYVVYKEIQKLSHQEEINQQDRNKIIQISKILTLMNDTESAGRVAIRTDDREALQVFLEKNVTLQEIKKELENIGLSGSTEKPVRELSGGMKRRVAIIRSIMADSDIVVFDEPFKGLDVETRKTVIEYLKKKLKDRTVIMVTHDIDEALALNCKIINLK